MSVTNPSVSNLATWRVGAGPVRAIRGSVVHSVKDIVLTQAGRPGERHSFISRRDLRVRDRHGRDARGPERYILIWLKKFSKR